MSASKLDDADSGATQDCDPALWTCSVCLVGARRTPTDRNFKHLTPRHELESRAKGRSHVEFRRSFVLDCCCARFQDTSIFSARLFSSGACNLRTSWLHLLVREFFRSLRWGRRVPTSRAASTRRFGSVARARGNCDQTVAARLLQPHAFRARN